jgi:hypothetical protein
LSRAGLAIELAVLVFASCLPAPKTGCRTTDDCLHNRVCLLGTCRPGPAQAELDANADVVATSDLIAASPTETDVPSGTSDGGLSVDDGNGGAENGRGCTTSTDCLRGNCVDGICCDLACRSSCYACAQLYTGKLDGTCAPIGAGKKDPHGACMDETATNQCGNDGYCDGVGACQKADKTQSCGTASCSGTKYIPASTCDGVGGCKAVSPIDCGSFACSLAAGGCLTTCMGNVDCSSTTYCDLTLAKPLCMPKAKPGDADNCGTDGSKCTTGLCVDGVCCSASCARSCYACNIPGKLGTCSAVAQGALDPKGVCVVSGTTCGTNGQCNQNGGCSVAPAGTTGSDCTNTCTDSVSGSGLTTRSCDGKGACSESSQPCNNIVCASNKTQCKASCAANADCTGGAICTTDGKSRCAPICRYDDTSSLFDDRCVLGP